MKAEEAFILGALEDGYLSRRKRKGEFLVEIEQKNREWLEIVAENFEKSFGIKPKITKRKRKNVYRLRIYSKNIFLKLQKMRKNFKQIIKTNEEVQKSFLRGICDAEGSVDKNKYRITISSKNKKLLKFCQKLIQKFGIKTKKLWKYKWGVYVLPILGKENLRKFNEIIGFLHPEKKAKLLMKFKE